MKKLTISSYLLFFVLLTIVIFKNFTLRNNLDKQKINFEREKVKFNEIIIFLHRKDSLETVSNNINLNLNLNLFSPKDNYYIKLQEIFKKNKEYLVLRLTEQYCMSCYDFIFEYLNQIKKTKIIILASYKYVRNVNVIFNNLEDKYAIYNVKEQLLIPIENLKTPYLFLIDDGGKCFNFHAVDKSNPNNLDNYLLNIKP